MTIYKLTTGWNYTGYFTQETTERYFMTKEGAENAKQGVGGYITFEKIEEIEVEE